MAEGAGRIADFSKLYRQQAHHHQRIGMTPQSIPRLEDVDEMIKQGEKIQISLQRMREVVYSHQQASLVEQPQEARYRPINGYDHEGPNAFHDDGKGPGGFAGPDLKKQKRGVSPCSTIIAMISPNKAQAESCSTRKMSQLQSCRNPRMASRP